VLALALAAPAHALAEVELTADLSVGGGAIVTGDRRPALARFGGHAEATFLRDSNRDVGVGVYCEAMTSSFENVMGGVGVLALFPVHRALPLVLFLGPHYVYSGEHDAGLGGRLWFGLHNHNDLHPYNGTLGIWVEVRADLTHDRDVLIGAGLDIDPGLFVYPFLWLERWARGPRRL
jgi:hypothetical protein